MPDAAVWEDIKHAYETSPETVIAIAARFDVKPRTLSARATADAWQRPKRDHFAPLAAYHAERKAKADAVDWEPIRTAYETSAETVETIAEQFAITRDQIRRQAKLADWTRRPAGTESLLIANAKRAAGLYDEAPNLATKAARPRRGGGTETHRKAIIARLYDVTDAKLAVIETRIAAGTKLVRADADRETRDIASILKTMEKLLEFSHGLARAAAQSGEPKPGTAAGLAASHLADDAERLRQDLAQRFQRLTEHREHTDVAGDVVTPGDP